MSKKIQKSKGFTLLEILVVVALIGLFAAVVMVALGTSKGRGDDAAIRSNINGLRSQAELYYVNNKKYGFETVDISSCTAVHTFIASTTGQGAGYRLTNDLIKNARGIANIRCAVSANGTTWAVAATLINGGYVCAHGTDQSIIASTTGLLANSIVNNACVR